MMTTNAVADICRRHGVPLDHGFVMADFLIHGRQGYWLECAYDWFRFNKSPIQFDIFVGEIGVHAAKWRAANA